MNSAPFSFCLFGKHPAAADHLEELGAVTPGLAAFQQDLYVRAVGDCIARSVWAGDLPHGARPPYDHYLLTLDGEDWIVARLIASRDASGREQYPLVACVQGRPAEALRRGAPLWAWLDRQIRAAQAAEDLAQLRQVSEAAVAPGGAGDLAPHPARDAWVAAQGAGLERAAHALATSGAGTRQARVSLAGAPETGILFWAAFLSWLARPPVLTLLWAAGADFADVSLGPPSAGLLRFLFASAGKVPPVTSVPFSITEDTRRHTATAIADWLAADTCFPDAAAPETEPAPLQKMLHDFRAWWRASIL